VRVWFTFCACQPRKSCRAARRAILESSGALYGKLHIAHGGHAGSVPIVHKSAAVSKVIAQPDES
jgi:hypothetical protein